MKEHTTSERLNAILKEKGLRPIDLVNRCQPYCEQFDIKMGRNDISQYLSGKVEPSQKKLSVLSKALDVDEVWLMGYDVSMEDNNKVYSDELDILFDKTKPYLSEYDKTIIKTILQEKRKEIDKQLGEDE